MKSTPIFTLIYVVIFALLCSCAKQDALTCDGILFGIPNKNTGLSDKRCKPECACKEFVSKQFTSEQLDTLKSWKLTVPYQEITENPYKQPLIEKEKGVCAVVVDSLATKEYHLETFPSEEVAVQEGAYVTHTDACGVCSTLQDLAVYAGNLDIGADVKKCGLDNFIKPFEELVACIESLGFSRPCAQIWAYNTRNTQEKCLDVCLEKDSYNAQSGALSPCLQCDEVKSGPVFKAVAGRTRRNTGIANSICRPCTEVNPIQHNYPE